MDRQFRGQVTDGLILPILELLVRSNHTVLGFRYVRLDDAGKVIERAADYKAPGKIGDKGVEIDFRSDDDQSIHKLMYFSVNLSDTGLRENQAFLAFLGSLKGTATLLKATSYMTHKQEFSMIRERVLAKSIAVLQDDSGIPYRFFTAPPWTVQLYGAYDRPYGSFRWFEAGGFAKSVSGARGEAACVPHWLWIWKSAVEPAAGAQAGLNRPGSKDCCFTAPHGRGSVANLSVWILVTAHSPCAPESQPSPDRNGQRNRWSERRLRCPAGTTNPVVQKRDH